MKSIVVALLALTLVIGSAKGNPGSRESPMEEMREIVNEIIAYFQGESPQFPIVHIAQLIAKYMPCPDRFMRKMFLEHYNMICGAYNCERDAPRCLDAFMPEDMCQLHKTCLPGALISIPIGLNPFLVMEECFMREMMTSRGLEYEENSHESNIQKSVEALVSNSGIAQVAKDRVTEAAYTNRCLIPPKAAHMTDCLKFKICMMNICIDSMGGF